MIFDENSSNFIYNNIYNWLTNYTPGENRSTNFKKNYHKTWSLISNKIYSLFKKEKLSDEEKDFLKLTCYTGTIYRLHQYTKRRKGYIYPSNFYHAWSKNIAGMKSVKLYGDILLITGHANNAIDVFGVLTFLIKNECITNIEPYKFPQNLCRYESEEEIEYPLNIDSVSSVFLIDSNNLEAWHQYGEPIPKDRWWLSIQNQD